MIIRSIRVQNFRCILDATLNCEPLTALVGPNGCGKSSFLRALELFYAPTPKFTIEDFYSGDTSREIEITVTFAELNQEAMEKFAAYLDGKTLSVTRVLSIAEKASHKFFGLRLQNGDFVGIRNAGSATAAKQLYSEIRKDGGYADLPLWTSQPAAIDSLKEWERAHADKCKRLRDEGQFFGFTEVAQGYVGRFTRLVAISAVRDASEDAEEGRGSPITELMDAVVRSTLADREELRVLREDIQRRYQEIVNPANLVELAELAGELTSTLGTYVPDAKVELAWLDTGEIAIPLPKADVKLVEDGYAATVGRTGHGLQRAFILSILQHLAVVQSARAKEPPRSDGGASGPVQSSQTQEGKSDMPVLVIAIEEPELYQHPSRQRHLANVLFRLAGDGIGGALQRTQVIYATHSPLFVGVDRFNQIRRLLKTSCGTGGPRVTKVIEVLGDSVAEEIWLANGGKDTEGNSTEKFSWSTLAPRLKSVMTPWVNEGFFADVAVLVEGEEDRAAIAGTARAMGYDLESQGVTLIPCSGKCNLDRPLAIFRRFGIATYSVWDGDEGDHEVRAEDNHRLLRLVGEPKVDWPETKVGKSFAHFKHTLAHTMREEIGEADYDRLLADSQKGLGIHKRKQAMKNQAVIEQLLHAADREGQSCRTLKEIVEAIRALRLVTGSEPALTAVAGLETV